jgi:UDP-N-acetylglucosamine 2-epimerase (non-hydrolysing)
MATALAAFYQRVPVAHVEAGLRTGDLGQPFPEELNRVFASRLARLHFAPTRGAADNLSREGIPATDIHVTGNTGIDALLYTAARLEHGRVGGFAAAPLDTGKRLILVTAHRRESFGAGFAGICQALKQLAGRGDVQIVYPVHPNPIVRQTVFTALRNTAGITLVEPQEYVPFVDLMRQCDLILTDSGGIQEEAPSLHKPVLVLRDKTERQEAVAAGTARLVGTDPSRIVTAATDLLEKEVLKKAMTRHENPFGDGRACPRIAQIIARFLST